MDVDVSKRLLSESGRVVTGFVIYSRHFRGILCSQLMQLFLRLMQARGALLHLHACSFIGRVDRLIVALDVLDLLLSCIEVLLLERELLLRLLLGCVQLLLLEGQLLFGLLCPFEELLRSLLDVRGLFLQSLLGLCKLVTQGVCDDEVLRLDSSVVVGVQGGVCCR